RGAVAPGPGTHPDRRGTGVRDDEGGSRTVAARLSAAGRDRARDSGNRPPTGGLRLVGSLGGSVVADVPPRLRIVRCAPPGRVDDLADVREGARSFVIASMPQVRQVLRHR